MTFNFQVPVGLIVDLVGTFHWAPEAEAVLPHPSMDGASDAAPVEPEPDPALKEKEVPRKSALVLCHTVDGQNPAPPIMMVIPLFIGF